MHGQWEGSESQADPQITYPIGIDCYRAVMDADEPARQPYVAPAEPKRLGAMDDAAHSPTFNDGPDGGISPTSYSSAAG